MKVLILMGSDSDRAVMRKATDVLRDFGVPGRLVVASAHRTPERVRALVSDGEKEGVRVFIAGAGMAAHLAGFVAAHTVRPVIGVPIASSSLNGMDSLLATAQMPKGVPVACVALDGAANAALLAVQMLAVDDDGLHERLVRHRERMADEVRRKSEQGEG